MIDTLLGSILVMMMPMGFSFAQIGIVTMAVMLAKRPLQIIGDNLSKVYFQRLSDVAQGLSIRPRVGRNPHMAMHCAAGCLRVAVCAQTGCHFAGRCKVGAIGLRHFVDAADADS